MADYGTVKAALADALTASDNLTVVYANVPDVYTSPCAVLVPGDNPVEYHGSMRGQGFTVFEFKVQVMVQRFDMEFTVAVLDKFVHGPDSVDALVRADRTLGGVAADCVVLRCNNIGQVLAGDDVYLGAEFDVEVMVAP
jgi:hypothetical protein